MARIKTDRPEAAQYNGMEATFVREVVDNEPAYSAETDQTVVNIDGVELYFYASEVTLTDDEQEAAEEQLAAFAKAQEKARKRTGVANANKQKLFATYKRAS